jgi:hypothetical protein
MPGWIGYPFSFWEKKVISNIYDVSFEIPKGAEPALFDFYDEGGRRDMRTINMTKVHGRGNVRIGVYPAVLLAFVLVMSACSMKFMKDPAEGFRGVAWGSPPGSIKGLEIIHGQETLVIGKRSNENLRMGEARLEEIQYFFMHNALFQVEVRAKGRKNLWHMRKDIERHYGPPASFQDQISHYFWRGENWAIHLNYYSMGDRVIALYSHVSAAGSQGTGK